MRSVRTSRRPRAQHSRGVAWRLATSALGALCVLASKTRTTAEDFPPERLALHDTKDAGVTTGLPSSAIHQAGSQNLATEASAYRIGALVVTRPWLRPAPRGARSTAGYLVISNLGNDSDRLIGASAKIAGELEIHASEVTDGIARMRAMREGIEIPAHSTVELRPGGKHLMFGHLDNMVGPGERFEATLLFEKAGPLVVVFDVRNDAAAED
jgi:copper(I)-binding protein